MLIIYFHKLSLAICCRVQQHHTLPCAHAYHILLGYANFSALHIDYTDSESSYYTREYILAIYLVNYGTTGQCNVCVGQFVRTF